MELKNYQKRLWAEIDLDAIKHNYKQIGKDVCCVVKANAYGHGAIEIAKVYEELGCKYFAVATISEALELRKNKITKPILILGYTDPTCANILIDYNITQCVYSLEYAKMLSSNARDLVKVHLKIDTGMGRIGFQYHDGVNELNDAVLASKLSNIDVEGIFMHFAISDEGINDFTYKQYDYFTKAVSYLENIGLKFKLRHVCNSGAIIDYPQFHLDMVRAGIILYGSNPTDSKFDLKPTISLKSVVTNVKEIRSGDSVSYGRTFIAKKNERIATVACGYADGFFRTNSGSYVMINGKKCKIIGRVCMDQMMVLSDDAKIGDTVTIIGPGIEIEKVAEYNHTISYEVMCAISRRVPRVYLENGKIVKIVDYLD